MARYKRIWCLFLVFALLLGLTATAMAAPTPTVSISSAEAKPGDTVTLTVSIENNPGIAAAILYIYYDTDVFELEEIYAMGEFAKRGGLLENTIAVAAANGRYDGPYGKDGALGYWYNKSGCNTSGDGVMMAIVLRVNANASNGAYEIGLGYSTKDVCNEDGDKVALMTQGGTITISGGTSQGGQTGNTGSTGQIGGTTQPEKPTFYDVSGNWAEDYIYEVASQGLIVGYQGLYRPNDSMTRAEFVNILWRACGSPAPKTQPTFKDLDPNQKWYWDGIAWAAENKVMVGLSTEKFDPSGSVTREQLVSVLHRLAGSPVGMEAMFTGVYDASFADSGKISSWAKNSVYWSVYNEILCGESAVELKNTLAPTSAATRAQIAVMLVRYLED